MKLFHFVYTHNIITSQYFTKMKLPNCASQGIWLVNLRRTCVCCAFTVRLKS